MTAYRKGRSGQLVRFLVAAFVLSSVAKMAGCIANAPPEEVLTKTSTVSMANDTAEGADLGVSASAEEQTHDSPVDSATGSGEESALPCLLDLGAGKCIPCKMMAPILEELREEYKGRMDVVFLDVWEDPQAAEAHGVTTIPTQIFYDASGKERFRHEGFFSKEDILAKWNELGVNLAG